MAAVDHFVGSQEETRYAKDIPVDVPSGVQSGDTLIAWITANDAYHLTPPGGWTQLFWADIGTTTRVWMYARTATSVDAGGTWTWVFNNAHWHAVIMSAWNNIADIRSYDINHDSFQTSIDIPSLQAETDDILIGHGYHFELNSNDAPQLNTMAEVIPGSNLVVGGYEDASGGSTPTHTVTTDGGHNHLMAGASVLLVPAGEGEGDEEESEQADVNLGVEDGYGYIRLVTIPGRPHKLMLDTNDDPMFWIDINTSFASDQTAEGGHLLPGIIYRELDNGDYYMLRVWFRQEGDIHLDSIFYDASDNTVSGIGGGVTTDVTYDPLQQIHVRARVTGRAIHARVWNDSETEPSDAQYVFKFAEETIGGNVGLGFYAFGDNTNDSPEFRVHYFWINHNLENKIIPIIDHLLGPNVKKVVDPENSVLNEDKEWDPGESKKVIINELLGLIDYESLNFDEEGRAVLKPYLLPEERSSEYEYANDDISVLYPEVSRELDLFDVANKWVLASNDPDEKPTVAKVENNDPGNPTSTVRRGRTIVDYREEQGSSKSSLMRKARRIAQEASRQYESIDFETGLMPMHSFNDTYVLNYSPLNIEDKYTAHTWEMDLEAGASMRHTARRVVRLNPEADEEFIEGDLEVTGSIDAENFDYGEIDATTVADTPTSTTVTGYSLSGVGRVYVLVTANSSIPGDTLKEVSVMNESSSEFTLFVYRTNDTSTLVSWLAYRDPF